MRFCNTCLEFHGDDCPPEWVCRILGEDDTDYTVRAYSAEDAATRYAEDFDIDHEYTILRGEKLIVEVCRDGECERFHVEGESVPRYYAKRADPN